MKITCKLVFSMVLTPALLHGVLHAEDAGREFIAFGDFVNRVANADSREYLALANSRVKDPVSFEEMRQHILSMYQGVEVSHSFLFDSQYFDRVPIEKQPSVQLQHLATIETAPNLTSSVLAKPSDRRPAATQSPCEIEFDRYGNSIGCEQNTIPMRRITLEDMSSFGSLRQYFEKGPNGAGQAPATGFPVAGASIAHKYAVTYQNVKNFGGHSELNL